MRYFPDLAAVAEP